MQDNAQRLGGKIANVYRRIPERRTGFGGTLWPTAFPCSTCVEDFSTKSRQKSILRGFCALAMSMSGEVKARERRTATAARVCPRRTAAIPPSAARTAGFAVNDDGGQAQRRLRVCQGEPLGVAGHPLDEHRACVTSGSG